MMIGQVVKIIDNVEGSDRQPVESLMDLQYLQQSILELAKIDVLDWCSEGTFRVLSACYSPVLQANENGTYNTIYYYGTGLAGQWTT